MWPYFTVKTKMRKSESSNYPDDDGKAPMISSRIRLTALEGNRMKLDGGAMFGNAAKALWSRWMPSDDHNMIPIGSRALLIETGRHAVLFETGAGAYLSPDMKDRFRMAEPRHVLLDSLAHAGLSHEDITHVILSHLHFDHAGGLLSEWEEGRAPELLFPHAEFYVGKDNFERSGRPHLRDKASFIPGLTRLLEDSGRLKLLQDKDVLVLDEVRIEFAESRGHTPGMMLSHIKTPKQALFFAGDVAPAHAWVHLPITMGYDRFPEGLIDEKTRFFQRVLDEDAWIFYPHDPVYAASKLSYDEASNKYTPRDLIPDLRPLNLL